jgi:very-short-patch-repair endonuclease
MSSPATKRARKLRRNETEAEGALWRILRGQQFHGFKFRRQRPLAGYVLDFFCEELRLCVEVDGGQHGERAAEDAARTAALAALGVEVVRYWNNEVLSNLEGVWTDLEGVVRRRRDALEPRTD